MLRLILILPTLITLLSACSIWPAEGRGGQAEDHEYKTVYLNILRITNTERLNCFHREIQYLSAGTAGRIFPAKISQMNDLWNRARRAHGGFFDLEASMDLYELSGNFSNLIKLLNTAPPEFESQKPTIIKTTLLKHKNTAVEGACS